MQVKSIAEREHSAILSTFIMLPFSIRTFVLSLFKWPLKTGFSVFKAEPHSVATVLVYPGLLIRNFTTVC